MTSEGCLELDEIKKLKGVGQTSIKSNDSFRLESNLILLVHGKVRTNNI